MKFINPSWTKLPDLPWRMADPSSAILNGQMYVLGGYTGQAGYNVVYGKMYAWDGTEWVEKADMPVPVWGQASIVYNNEIWVFGGQTASADVSTIQKYNSITDTWEIVGTHPYKLGQGVFGVAVGQYAYLRFGSRGQNAGTGVYFTRYDMETEDCITLAAPPSPTLTNVGNWGALDYYDGYLYELGGASIATGNGVDYVTKYNIATNTWSSVGTSMPIGVYGHVRENLVHDGKLWVSAGQRASGEFFSALWSYDLTSGAWDTHELAPYAADGVAGGWLDGKFYLLGGRSANVQTSGMNDAAVFDPANEVNKDALMIITGNQIIRDDLLQRHYPAYGSINTNPPNSQLCFSEELAGDFDKTLTVEALDSAGWAALLFSTSPSTKYSTASGVSLKLSNNNATVLTVASGTETQVSQTTLDTSGRLTVRAKRTGSVIEFTVNGTSVGTVSYGSAAYAHLVSKLNATNSFSDYEQTETHDLDVILNLPDTAFDLDVILNLPTFDLDVILTAPSDHTVTVTKTGDGTVSPLGPIAVTRGASLTVTIAPAAGQQLQAVLVDGVPVSNVLTGPESIGKVVAYNFNDVRDNHTLEVIFEATSGLFDWTQSHEDSFEFIRVDARTLQEREALIGISRGGSISENLNTTLKASGQLEMVGDLDIRDDLIRIYLNATSDTASVRLALGTFFASTPSRTVSDVGSTASVDLYSLLLQLDEDRVENTYTVPAGTNAITHAKALVTGAGLKVNATPSTSTTTTAAVFEAGASKLEIINYLLDYAGYSSAYVDGMGTVMMTPYTNPSTRQPVWTFTDGDSSIFFGNVTDELDWYSTPNVVVVTCSNADTTMTATAVNSDPSSPYSTVNRGRRIVRHESVSDIETQAALNAKAAELLESSSSAVQKATITHTYAPFALGDVVRLNYQSADIDYAMSVQSRELKLTPGVPITTTMRRFVRA